MYVDDCVEGTQLLTNGDVIEPLNLGSSELVSINQLVDIVEDLAGIAEAQLLARCTKGSARAKQ